MVWVSNHCAYTIHVSITNYNGGSDNAFAIPPPSAKVECYGQNQWRRSGPETLALLREGGGKEQTVQIGPSDFVMVYPDAVVVTQANVYPA